MKNLQTDKTTEDVFALVYPFEVNGSDDTIDRGCG
jgi:hypothetical protein